VPERNSNVRVKNVSINGKRPKIFSTLITCGIRDFVHLFKLNKYRSKIFADRSTVYPPGEETLLEQRDAAQKEECKLNEMFLTQINEDLAFVDKE